MPTGVQGRKGDAGGIVEALVQLAHGQHVAHLRNQGRQVRVLRGSVLPAVRLAAAARAAHWHPTCWPATELTLESLYALAPSNSPPLIMELLRPSRPVVRPRRSPRSACRSFRAG